MNIIRHYDRRNELYDIVTRMGLVILEGGRDWFGRTRHSSEFGMIYLRIVSVM